MSIDAWGYKSQSKIRRSPFRYISTTLGTPQGDGLSPILFAIYLESALRKVRQKAGPRPHEDTGRPLEAMFADDFDFISLRTHH